MREHLLGYLLGALDREEQEQVERRLQRDAVLRFELKAVKQRLGPLESIRTAWESPEGLTERTCDFIERYRQTRALTPAGQAAALAAEPPASRWSLADLIVAGGIAAAILMLLLPAIVSNRHLARVNTCQDNMRRIGIALADFSDRIGNQFFPFVPSVGKRGYAGNYATQLTEHELIDDQRVFICPDSFLAAHADGWSVPSAEDIESADGQELIRLQQEGGGSYGYTLGVLVNGIHRPPRNRGRPYFAIMSDAPASGAAYPWSANHGGRGFNLLFEDGHVRYCVGRVANHWRDDPFRNRLGEVAPGVDRDDAVIGGSATAPVIPAAVLLNQ